MNQIIKKWIEPYVLLETIKANNELVKDYTFDGFSKNKIKKDFLENLQKGQSFGLYMKNVNKFYLFNGDIQIEKVFNLESCDFENTEDLDKPFDMVDMGKAEACFIKL